MSLDMVDSCELLSTKLTLQRPSRTTMKETVSYKVVRRNFLHADLAELEIQLKCVLTVENLLEEEHVDPCKVSTKR